MRFVTDSEDSQLPALYRSAMAVFLPSVYTDMYGEHRGNAEYLGLTLLEAMAQGIPVVSTSIGCGGLEVVNGEHLLVDLLVADTSEDLVRATGRLLRDEALRQELVSNARWLVVERYDWNHIAEKLEAVYTGLC